jgi:DNA-binding transcriptional LysR family regulator
MRVPDCSLDLLVALVAAAESKTKAEAAGKLKISISALDKRFKTASVLYGTPLIQQSDRVVELTEEGQVLYPSALRSVAFASLAEESLRTHLLLKTHHILIGHSSYLAPDLLALIHRLKMPIPGSLSGIRPT